jgi:DNA-binding transcriptional LysR family regulator
MSQPPLSQQIKQLEQAIGTPLFTRTKRSVTLTSAGRDLYENLQPWMAELDEMFARTRRIGEGERGNLSVGCSYTTSQRLVPVAIRRFCERFPSVEVKLQEAPFDEQVEAVVRGLVDVAIIRLPVSHPDVVSIELYEEPLIVALPQGHRLAKVPRLKLRDLEHETLLNASRRPVGLFDSVRALCEHAGFSPKILDVSSSANSAVALVSAGMGIALVPEGVQRADHENVAYRTLVDSPRSKVGIVHRRTGASPATQLFVDVAIEVATGAKPARYARAEAS